MKIAEKELIIEETILEAYTNPAKGKACAKTKTSKINNAQSFESLHTDVQVFLSKINTNTFNINTQKQIKGSNPRELITTKTIHKNKSIVNGLFLSFKEYKLLFMCKKPITFCV